MGINYLVKLGVSITMEINMTLNYNKLWKLLIDRNMSKKELSIRSGVSSTTIAKLGRNANVNTDIIVKICLALNVQPGDILEIK